MHIIFQIQRNTILEWPLNLSDDNVCHFLEIMICNNSI